MGLFQRKPTDHEEAGGSGLHLDLDVLVCPECRRELHPWERACPDDGATPVPPTSLVRDDLPPPPAHLTEPDPDDEDPPGQTPA